MIKVSLEEAEGRLGRLMQEAAAGEEVVIAGAGGPAVRLVPVLQEAKEPKVAKPVGHALDRFMGTWTAEQETEVLEAVEVFEHVDESFWQ